MKDGAFVSRLLLAALGGSLLIAAPRAAQAQDSPSPSPADAATSTTADGPTPTSGDAPAAAPTPSAESSMNAVAAAPRDQPPPDIEPKAPPDVPESAKKDHLRFEIGGRLGYGMPFGDIASSHKLHEVFSGSVPGVLDGWLRFPGGFAIGLYLGLAAGISGHALDSCSNCSALNYRFGVQAARHFNDGGTLDPWVGVGIGGEWASITEQTDYQGLNITSDDTYSALPEISAHVGLDIGGDTVAFGPYASISYASFGKVKSTLSCSNFGCDENGVSSTADVDGGGHGWLSLGVRGTYLR